MRTRIIYLFIYLFNQIIIFCLLHTSSHNISGVDTTFDPDVCGNKSRITYDEYDVLLLYINR